MVGDSPVDKQEAVVDATAGLQRDGRVLRVVALEVELELPAEMPGVDGRDDAGGASSEHGQDRFVDVVVDECQ